MKAFYRNKTVLVTGAASGIGRRFAEQISAFGVTLILWDRDPELLRTLDIHKTTEVLASRVDVTDPRNILNEADQIIKGRFVPDIIVNCAGIVVGEYFRDYTFRDIEQTMMVNTVGSMLVANAFLPKMIERGSGQIVNMASAAGYLGNPKMSVYGASKWAVLGWAESLRLELKHTGVSVTSVIPGYVKTGMFEGVRAPFLVPLLKTDTLVKKMLKGIRKHRFKIHAPFMVRFTPLIKAILPRFIFDWLAGRVFRVYHSMDTFKGRP
ncbi:MAG: SDR family NAD(P)-dependent oxidoreductase [Balneolaceae bacterium]